VLFVDDDGMGWNDAIMAHGCVAVNYNSIPLSFFIFISHLYFSFVSFCSAIRMMSIFAISLSAITAPSWRTIILIAVIFRELSSEAKLP
jgi:hypothetical protein